MAGQVDEQVLGNFRVSEDDFRDLDAVVERHCKTVKYYVYKGSAQGGYDTDDVEVLLKERNGSGSRIESVMLHATGSEGLKFNVRFDDTVYINGDCEDRASLVLLATEARGLIQDRMKGGTLQRQNILYAITAIFFLLGFLGFQQYQNSYTNRYNANLARAEGAVAQPTVTPNQPAPTAAPSRPAQNVATISPQTLVSQAMSALSKHNLSAEIGLLLQQQIQQWQQQIATPTPNVTFSTLPASILNSRLPWWATSFWLALGVGCAAAVAAVGFVGYLIVPSSKSVFLIGDEKRRQNRAAKLRTQIMWGIVVAFIVGIASSPDLSPGLVADAGSAGPCFWRGF